MTVPIELSDHSVKNGHSGDGAREVKLKEHVGFDSLPEQYVNRVIRNGFVFNILVIGSTGVGKSTLIDSLFNSKFPESSARTHNMKTVDLHVQRQELQEKHIKMRLSVAETRGFGDQINKGMISNSFPLSLISFYCLQSIAMPMSSSTSTSSLRSTCRRN